jgi:hypothetical protein
MLITFEEYKDLLEKAYKFQELIQKTSSKAEFDEARRSLIELASNLRSDTGEFTPNVNYKVEDKESLEKIANRRRELKSEAEYLRNWVVKTSFENRNK